MPTLSKMGGRIPWGVLALEFVVVVAGILGAFAVEDWREARAEKVLEQEYLDRLRVEFDLARQFLEGTRARFVEVEVDMREALRLLDGPRSSEAVDSLAQVVGSIATMNLSLPPMPTVRELSATGNLRVIRHDVRIMLQLLEQRLVLGGQLADYERGQYLSTVEPLFVRKPIPYGVVSPRYDLVEGGPSGDLGALWGDLEFWNMAEFRLETNLSNLRYLEESLRVLTAALREVEIAVGARDADEPGAGS